MSKRKADDSSTVVEDQDKRARVNEEKPQVPFNGKPGDWSCKSCNHHNYNFRLQCQRCRTPKEGGAPVDGGAEQGGNRHPGDWDCPSCSYHNYASRVVCGRCQCPKAGGVNNGKHPGDWNCGNCGDLNYASRTVCRICQAPKSMAAMGMGMGMGGGGGELGNGVGRPGDWMCPNCNDHVYASRSACRKCGTPKPDMNQQGGMGPGAGAYGGFQHGGFQGDNMQPNAMANSYTDAGQGGYDNQFQSSGYPNQGNPNQGFGNGYGYGNYGNQGYGAQFGSGYGPMGGMGPGMNQMGGNIVGGRPGDWSCPSCGDHNYASRSVCRKCNGPRPSHISVGRPGDWNCPSCGDHNYASRTNCRKCNAEKTESSVQSFKAANNFPAQGRGGGKHPGDWNCPSCDDLNYASRTQCRLCNAPKPQ